MGLETGNSATPPARGDESIVDHSSVIALAPRRPNVEARFVPRAPFQVVVFPFRKHGVDFEYALFQRADDGRWQGIAGGGEDNEIPVAAAQREAAEEAGVPPSASVFRLGATSSVPAHVISETARAHWPTDLYVIPNYAFAADCSGIELRISREHREMKWVGMNDAHALLHYESDKVALTELDQRLRRSPAFAKPKDVNGSVRDGCVSAQAQVDGEVRRAALADRDQIVAIDQIALAGDRARCELIENAIASGTCLVVAAGTRIDGFVVCSSRTCFGRDFIDLLIVERSRRRDGLGSRLLAAAVRAASTERVFTSTNQSNKAMESLLHHAGWHRSGELIGLDEADPEIVFFIDRSRC